MSYKPFNWLCVRRGRWRSEWLFFRSFCCTKAGDERGREKLREGIGTQHNGDNTLMTVSSYGTNPQRRQDFEGKTIWRGQRQRRKKAHKHHAQAFLDVFLYIEISLAPLCVSNDNKRWVRKIGLHIQWPVNMCMGKQKRVNIQIYKYFYWFIHPNTRRVSRFTVNILSLNPYQRQ